MRCRKHIADYSSTVGVCASCLRDRLFVVIEAQVHEDRRRRRTGGKDAAADDNPHQLQFPRSVSPYVSRRKSDGFKIGTWQNQHQEEGVHGDQRFFSTPQVGPGGKIVGGGGGGGVKKKTGFGFRSKPEKPVADPDREDKNAGSGSRWWLVKMLFGRRRRRTNTSATDSLDKPENGGERRVCRKGNKGMSPAPNSDDEDEQWNNELNGTLSEFSKTPKRTPVWTAPGKRGEQHNRNGSGMAFCLSPLVRASPGRQWNQKGGVPPEMVVSGDMRVVPVKPSPSHPAAFNKNRSRKMADFGRCNLNR